MKRYIIGLTLLMVLGSVFAALPESFENRTEYAQWINGYAGTPQDFLNKAKTACVDAQGLGQNTIADFRVSYNQLGQAYVQCMKKEFLYRQVCGTTGCYSQRYGVIGTVLWQVYDLDMTSQPLTYLRWFFRSKQGLVHPLQ